MHSPERLAIAGGSPVKTTPYGTGKRFGIEEVRELVEALEQNTLFYFAGDKVRKFLARFNELYGAKYSVATSSGTAAIHVALGVSGVSVGDEVITSPITDQGTIIGILYQNAVPVFADVDPHTYNLDPQSVEDRITPRTKAIVAVHLAGNPCLMDQLMEIAERHELVVIEDCAQSYLTRYQGRLAGTWGDFGCFSTNDFKHISTGDGGVVLVNSDDEDRYRATFAFVDKNYQRFPGAVSRDAEFLAPNYRMTELQGAVGAAQLLKLPEICQTRHDYGDRLTEGICDLPGVAPHAIPAGGWCSYWFYMFRIDEGVLGCTRDEFATALKAEGINAQAGYIAQPVYLQPMFQRRTAYRGTSFPFAPDETRYRQGSCPNAEVVLRTAIRLPVSEFHTDSDITETITAIRKVAHWYSSQGAATVRQKGNA